MFESDSQSEPKKWEVLSMIKRHPVISVFIVVALVAVGVFFVFRSSQATNAAPKNDKATEKPKEERKQPVEVAEVKKGVITNSIITTATLEPDKQVTVVSETNGIVDKLMVEEGDLVREGQVLTVLSDEQKHVALEKAQIRYDNAKRELERKQRSWDEKLIPKMDYDKAKYEMEVALAEKNEAAVNVKRTVIRAPFTGTVTQRFIERGQNINPQAQLFTIADLDPLEAKIYLPEKEVYGIQEGQIVSLVLNAQKNISFQGRIKYINPAVDSKTGTVKITVEVTKAPAAIRSGSFVDARLETQRHENTILVPKKALMEESGERFVYVIEKDKAARRIITVGFVDDQNAEILSGVRPGEKIVTSGQGSLRDGSKAEIIAKK